MSSTAVYTFNTEGRPAVPGAFWMRGNHTVPNTPLPGISHLTNCGYLPFDVYCRRTYESDDHGWIEVKGRRNERSGWRGTKKSSKGRGTVKMTMNELISSLGGKSYLIV